jgi:acyl-CoA synthetase (AMP-forming)/AMP-acid ligase II
VQTVVSAGAIWSAEVKDGLRARLSATLVDALGSTEGGTYALSSADHDHGASTARFRLSPETKVVTEDGREVARGSTERGLLASKTSAYGYFKDREKTDRTFIELGGERYVITGDWATVDADGAITLLGRGSNCINSGGEKIFPEEVEEAIKRHPRIDDCLVVGVPDERFGQRVVAVVGAPGDAPPTAEEIRKFLLTSLAHYKIPRALVVRPAVRRAPNGKADYQWALAEALAATS